jgi:hypothetical protein
MKESITLWQAEVNAGSAPATTVFTEVSAPILTSIGTLTGGRAFEFIVNADPSTTSSVPSALPGTQSADRG